MNLKKILIITSLLFLILKGYWVLTEEKLERTLPHAHGTIIIKSARVLPFYPSDSRILRIYNQYTTENTPKHLYSWDFCGKLSLADVMYDKNNSIVAIRPCYSNCKSTFPGEPGTYFYGAHLEVTNHSDGQLTIEFVGGGTEY